MTTCQVCGREIKAKLGRIAHHGYNRPGGGYQTSSCYGARKVPYEVGHDALDAFIKLAEEAHTRHKASLAKWMTEPPAEIRYTRRDAYGSAREREQIFTRPEGFVPGPKPGAYQPNTYHGRFWAQVYETEAHIKYWLETLRYLKARREAWVPPK